MQRKKKASLTVEAALVLPIFVFAALSILYINKMILYEEEVQWALTRTAREASVEYAASGKEISVNPVYLTGKMRQYLKEDLPVSMLRSRFNTQNDQINLVAEYSVTVPFPVISSKPFHFTERIVTRAFTGVLTRQGTDKEDGGEIVYVTKTGTVYHRSLSCTHLSLSISQVKYGDLGHLRSEDGGKYYPCEGCCQGKSFTGGSSVYICNYGNRYHSYRTCKKIKRSIQEIRLSQAGNRLPCTKCGKE